MRVKPVVVNPSRIVSGDGRNPLLTGDAIFVEGATPRIGAGTTRKARVTGSHHPGSCEPHALARAAVVVLSFWGTPTLKEVVRTLIQG